MLCRIDTLLQSNIRGRLDAAEHATLNLLRARADGRVIMAGTHEDVIVHRQATGVCGLIPTDGVWVGISEDISEATREQRFRLDPATRSLSTPMG